MRAKLPHHICVFLILFSLLSCKKNYDFKTDQLSDYINPKPGNFIIYRTDSTVFTNFGRTTEIHSYLEKQLVDAMITDGMGRPSYRILRFLQDTTGTQPWAPAGTFMITPGQKTVEFIEDNLRFVKLAMPISLNFAWKGNEYLPDLPYGALYSFNNDASMAAWLYTYVNLNDTFSYSGTPLQNVINVTAINNPNFADTLTVTGISAKLGAKSLYYVRGSAADTVTLSAPVPTDPNFKLSLYNRSNAPLKLGSIAVPSGTGRNFQYNNGQWVFGDLDNMGNRLDTLYTDLPYGSMDLSVDKYAKGIGWVYQHYELWEYQPIYGSNDDGYKNGFGVVRRMINHN